MSGLDNFDVSVGLSDFFLDFPVQENDEGERMLWTDFKRADANSTYCSTKCQHSPTCFDYFFSDFGCFFIRGNLTKPATSGPAPSAVQRKLSGHLFGCRDTGTGQGECPRTDLSEGRLRFRGVKPDWRGELRP